MGVVNTHRSRAGFPWPLIVYVIGVLGYVGYLVLTAPKAVPQPCICTPSAPTR